MKQTLYMLIGPKGSGKTHVGTLVDRHTGIRFLRVEPIWLSLQPGEDGWKQVELAVDGLFETHEEVMIESLGVGDGFRSLHAALAKKYRIVMIRVVADPDTCLARVKSRSSADHIAVSDDMVREYNELAAGVAYDWDLEIDNSAPAADAGIIDAILSIDEAAEPIERDPAG